MRNKAQKRFLEMEAYEEFYTIIKGNAQFYWDNAKDYKERKAESLRDNPEEDTEYYESQIEYNEIKAQALEKVAELIFKLM